MKYLAVLLTAFVHVCVCVLHLRSKDRSIESIKLYKHTFIEFRMKRIFFVKAEKERKVFPAISIVPIDIFNDLSICLFWNKVY